MTQPPATRPTSRSRYRYRLLWIAFCVFLAALYLAYQIGLSGRVNDLGTIQRNQGDTINRITRTIQHRCGDVCRAQVVADVLRRLARAGVEVPAGSAQPGSSAPRHDSSSTPNPTGSPPAATPTGPTTPSGSGGGTTGGGTGGTSGGGSGGGTGTGGGGGGTGGGGTTPPADSPLGDTVHDTLGGAADSVEQTLDGTCALTQQVAGLCL